jgi:carboxylesterase
VTSAGWHEDVARAYTVMQAEHRSVSVVGLSMGGALAASLASREKRIEVLVLLVPYLAMPAALRAAAVSSRAWGWLFPYFLTGGRRSIHDPVAAAGALGYGVFTPSALRALSETVVDGWNALPAISAATLAIHSREDNRISASNAAAAFARVGSADKKLVWIEGAGHVVTVDYGHERVFELTAEWLNDHTPHFSRGPARAKGP